MLEACYLVVPVLEGAVDFGTLWRGSAPPATRRAWTRELGRVARRAHDVGLLQDDFAPNNFLVCGESKAQLFPIDFERARLGRAPLGKAARVRMLATLDHHLTGASTAARMRLLDAYFAGDRERIRAYWQAIAAAAPALARRDFAHLLRSCAREGRRYRRFAAGEGGAWRGWSRCDPSALAVVERDLIESPPISLKFRSPSPLAG